MKIKRFTAPDMRSALRQVREEQGEQAVILSSRRIETGVEVVAATDYDEALAHQAMRLQASLAPQAAARPAVTQPATRSAAVQPAARAATAPAQARPAPVQAANARPLAERIAASQALAASPIAAPAARATAPAIAVAPKTAAVGKPAPAKLQPVAAVAVAAVRDPAIESMRRELSSMRVMIETEMGRFSEERLRGVPVRAMAMDELMAYGCDRELARSIATSIPANADRSKARGLMLGLLAKSLLIPTREPIDQGGVVALVGPTGVGKTTTVAKLAARYAASHKARDVALVTTDCERNGGREQLAMFGRQLGMPVFEAHGANGLIETLDRLADYPLVLIDTAGFGPRDRSLAAQFNWMSAARRVRSYLVLPANAQAEDLDDVIRQFRCAAPEGAILSKLDETGRLGSSLSVVVRHRLPLAYITDGQDVPKDLHRAEAHRLVLRMGELRRDARKNARTEIAHAIA